MTSIWFFFFGLFFIGKHLTQNKLLIKDLIDPEKGIGQIFKTLWYIIFVTFTVELIGAYSIFVSIGEIRYRCRICYISLYSHFSIFVMLVSPLLVAIIQ